MNDINDLLRSANISPEQFYTTLIYFGIVASIIYFVFYIIKSIGLMRLASNQKIKNSWIAFVPLINNYILGKIVQREIGIKNIEFILLSIPIISLALSIIGNFLNMGIAFTLFSFLFTAVFDIFLIYVNYTLFKIYTPKEAVLYTVIGIFVPFALQILIFIIRNKPTQFLTKKAV